MKSNLVLGRKIGESIVLSLGGEEVLMTVLDARPAHVRLAFKANEQVQIDRLEHAQWKKRNKKNG